jgi:hypothetical protein
MMVQPCPRRVSAIVAHPEKPCEEADELARSHLYRDRAETVRLAVLRAEVQVLVHAYGYGQV